MRSPTRDEQAQALLDGTTATSPSHAPPRWTWLAGLLLGALVLGPGLEADALLNLDLVLFDRVPAPWAFWGLGSELPHRAPITYPISWLAPFSLSPLVWKLSVVFSLAACFTGAARLTRSRSWLVMAGAGVLLALNPFVLTRIAVGHIAVVAATASLAWALPRLLNPSEDTSATFLWLALLGLCGVFGFVLAAPALLVGVVRHRLDGWVRLGGLFLLAQLPWLVPGLFAWSGKLNLADSSHFSTDLGSVTRFIEAVIGLGFWQRSQQIGTDLGLAATAVGVALLGLACWGRRGYEAVQGGGATVLGVVGLAAALISGVPLLSDLFESVSGTPLGAPARESYRLLPLFLVWLAPAAALGAQRLAQETRGRRAALVGSVPLMLGLLLSGPGLWGLDGRVAPVRTPTEWEEARALVEERPGAVLAIPYSRYFDVSFADYRRVLNPASVYFGQDVLISADPQLDEGIREASDPRDGPVRQSLLSLIESEPAARKLADVGVRWVVLMKEGPWTVFVDALDDDPGLQRVVDARTLNLYQVLGWKGPAVEADGSEIAVSEFIAPIAHSETSGHGLWMRPGDARWYRGWSPTSVSREGLVVLPSGGGLLWYWPAVLVFCSYLLVGGATIWAVVNMRSRRIKHRV